MKIISTGGRHQGGEDDQKQIKTDVRHGMDFHRKTERSGTVGKLNRHYKENTRTRHIRVK